MLISKFDVVGAAVRVSNADNEVKNIRKELEIASKDELFGTFVRDMLEQAKGFTPITMIAFVINVALTVGVLAERGRLRRKGIIIPED